MPSAREALQTLGVPDFDPGPPYPLSQAVFPDGRRFRIEIPEVENPAVFTETLAAARRMGVRIDRVSQGTGITLLTDAEIREMARMGTGEGIEVCLFVGARATHDTGAQAYSRRGASVGLRLRGATGLGQGLADVFRAVELGIRCILVADEGLISVIGDLRARGGLPADVRIKSSAAMAAVNPVICRLYEKIGVDSINLGTDLTVGMVAAIRQHVAAPLDFYVESPPDLGGFARYHELPDLVRVGAPIYLKFGLKNEVGTDPCGEHLMSAALSQTRERVRRAAIGLELLRREMPAGAPADALARA